MASPLLKSLPKDDSGQPISDLKMFMLLASAGQVEGFSVVHKSGRNNNVSTTLVPVCDGGVWPTPAAGVTLEAVSDSTDDTSAGDGARTVTLTYIDATTFQETEGTFTMAGTSASNTITNVLRVIDAKVATSGSYGASGTGSQKGVITIRVESGGATWAELSEIGTTTIGLGEAHIGCYTVPAGKNAYMVSAEISVDSNKDVDVYFFKRENLNTTSAPYDGILTFPNVYEGVNSTFTINHDVVEEYPEYTDLGFMAKVDSTAAAVSVEFELLLVDV